MPSYSTLCISGPHCAAKQFFVYFIIKPECGKVFPQWHFFFHIVLLHKKAQKRLLKIYVLNWVSLDFID